MVTYTLSVMRTDGMMASWLILVPSERKFVTIESSVNLGSSDAARSFLSLPQFFNNVGTLRPDNASHEVRRRGKKVAIYTSFLTSIASATSVTYPAIKPNAAATPAGDCY